MKVTIERSVLLKALSHVQSVVERRNTIPILSNVLMRAESGTLSLTATDLDIEIVERVPADVDSEGAVTASAATLFDIVKKLPEGSQVRLDDSGDDGRISILAGKSNFKLAALPDNDFPALTREDDGTSFYMPVADLLRLIDKSRFAMSQEETRYYLNGIYFHAYTAGDRPSLRAVATDGHRLACLDAPMPAGADGIDGVIIPRKTVLELRRLLDDVGEQVQVTVSASRIRFVLDDMQLTSKLIDGTFPDYERVIPSDNDRLMVVDNADFRRAVDRVSTVSADKTRSVKLSVAEDVLELLVNNPETGTATEEISVDFASTDRLDIGFNAKYLLDIADQVGGDMAHLHFSDAASPTLIKDADDENAVYVLMPLRV